MDDLRARLVALLQGVWSATLDGWDKKEADLEHLHPGAWFTSAKNATRLFPAPSKRILLLPHPTAYSLFLQ